MSTSLRLHALFATLLGATAVAVGCNGTVAVESDAGTNADGGPGIDGAVLPDGAVPDAPPPPRDGGDGGTLPPFDTRVCLTQDETNFLFPKDATLAADLDSLGGYTLQGDSKPTGMTASGHKVGTACASATDPVACTTELDAFDPTTPYWSGCQGFCPTFPAYQVRTTKGAGVSVIGKREDVKKAFLPIDRPSEAAAAVQAIHSVGCEEGKNNVLKNGDGSYDVKVLEFQCTQLPADPSKSVNTTDEIAYRVTRDGTITEVARVRVKEEKNDFGCPVAGRKPMGLRPANENGGSCAGQYFAKMAHLEAASVVAFSHMVDELRFHGAPEELVSRAIDAIADERRHADAIGGFAHEHGARVPEVVTAPARMRSLLEMAIENRREGCVRETYGALLAHYQAHASTDAAVKRAMRLIAHDETLHAALSWDLDAWLVSKLDVAELEKVRAAEVDAIDDLAIECAQRFDAETRAVVGLPTPEVALDLFANMQKGLGLAA